MGPKSLYKTLQSLWVMNRIPRYLHIGPMFLLCFCNRRDICNRKSRRYSCTELERNIWRGSSDTRPHLKQREFNLLALFLKLIIHHVLTKKNMTAIEKIYETLKTVFDHISKHLEVRQKYSAARRIFNSLLGV